MTVKKNYPEEIYPETATQTETGPIYWVSHRKDYECAYDLGYTNGLQAQKDPLAGWSNLTEAIKAGERIDWGALDGLEAKCVHPELGALTYKLEHNEIGFRDNPGGWYTDTSTGAWKQAFYDSWMGFQGWALYIKGDLPLVKQTADQLEPGTCFRARYEKNGETHNYAWAQLLKPSGQKPRVIFFSLALTTLFGSALPEDVEVVEVYGVGTFQTPKENA